MFEALLRLEFILCKSPPVLPNSPHTPRLTVNFRARLYFAEGAVDLDKRSRMLKKHTAFRSRALALKAQADRYVGTITQDVGREWIDWLRSQKRPMFGAGVEWMANGLDKGDVYDSVYRFESASTHACDLEEFLEPDEDGNAVPRLSPDVRMATRPLLMSTEFLLIAIGLVNDRFRLGYEQSIEALRNAIDAYCSRTPTATEPG